MTLGLYCAALLPAGLDGIDGLDTPTLPNVFCGAPTALDAPVLAPESTGFDLKGAVFAEDGFGAADDFAAVEGLKAGAGFEADADFGAGAGLVTTEGFEAGALAGAGKAFFGCGLGVV